MVVLQLAALAWSWNVDPLMQLTQLRSDVAVALVPICWPALQVLIPPQIRSDVAVAAVTWYSLELHTVVNLQVAAFG